MRFRKPDGSVTDELPAEQAGHYIAKGFVSLKDDGTPLNVAVVDNPETIAELATAIAEVVQLQSANTALLKQVEGAKATHDKAIEALVATHAKEIEGRDKAIAQLEKKLETAEAKIPKPGRAVE